MIILLFGQPASGKTTLAKCFISEANDSMFDINSFVHVDGDKWREVTENKDYSREGRLRNLKGAFDMALYLERIGFIPVLSFVTPYDELRQYLKSKAENLRMIYLTYSGDRGRNKNFASDFERPTSGEYLILDTSLMTINECLDKITNYVK